MKKITKEEAKKLNLVPVGYKHPVRAAIESLEAGEMLQITRKEFTWKGKTPTIFTNAAEENSKKKFRTYMDGKTGWVVERVE